MCVQYKLKSQILKYCIYKNVQEHIHVKELALVHEIMYHFVSV